MRGLWPDDKKKFQDQLYTPLLHLLGRDVVFVVDEYVDKSVMLSLMGYVDPPPCILFNGPLMLQGELVDIVMNGGKLRLYVDDERNTHDNVWIHVDCQMTNYACEIRQGWIKLFAGY